MYRVAHRTDLTRLDNTWNSLRDRDKQTETLRANRPMRVRGGLLPDLQCWKRTFSIILQSNNAFRVIAEGLCPHSERMVPQLIVYRVVQKVD